MLKQFVRAKDGRCVGVMVASVVDGQVRVGVSYARKSYQQNPTKVGGDRFDKFLGEELAVGRMVLGDVPNVPVRYYDQFVNFVGRINNYFADAEVVYHVDDYVNGLYPRHRV